jgi:hypothetical protein
LGLFPAEYSYSKKQEYYIFPKKDHYFVYKKGTKKHQLLVVAANKFLPTPKPLAIQPSPIQQTKGNITPKTSPPFTYLPTPKQAKYFRSFSFPMFIIVNIHQIGHGRPYKE